MELEEFKREMNGLAREAGQGVHDYAYGVLAYRATPEALEAALRTARELTARVGA